MGKGVWLSHQLSCHLYLLYFPGSVQARRNFRQACKSLSSLVVLIWLILADHHALHYGPSTNTGFFVRHICDFLKDILETLLYTIYPTQSSAQLRKASQVALTLLPPPAAIPSGTASFCLLRWLLCKSHLDDWLSHLVHFKLIHSTYSGHEETETSFLILPFFFFFLNRNCPQLEKA